MESTTKEERLAVKNSDLIQLYSVATPNGFKVAACLEELVALKGEDIPISYEPHSVDIRHGENREDWFLDINPNGKIPALVDPHGPEGTTVKVFESGAILLYLAEKFNELIPIDKTQRAEVISWLFWGSTTFSIQAKQFGFYYKYCPHHFPYCVERFAKECKRLLAVLNKQLNHQKHWIIGGKFNNNKLLLFLIICYNEFFSLDMYTVADICIWPWVYALYENYNNAAQVKL